MRIDLREARQAEIDRKVERARLEYPAVWRGLVRGWQGEGGDAAWLTYSACYLLRTAGVRWGLDPYSLFTRVGGGEQPDFAADLAPLQLAVWTHAHSDHLDLNLLRAVKHLPCTWVVPEFMLERVVRDAALPRERVIIPRPGVPVRFGGLTLTPFEALHMRGSEGVPEMGYLAEFSGRRWLFPGDTRTYAAQRLPKMEGVDSVFAHLWLGKACALQSVPTLLDEFCRFHAAFQPRRVVVTHLEEFGREAPDFWDHRHFQQVQSRFQELEPSIPVSAAWTGQSVLLE